MIPGPIGMLATAVGGAVLFIALSALLDRLLGTAGRASASRSRLGRALSIAMLLGYALFYVVSSDTPGAEVAFAAGGAVGLVVLDVWRHARRGRNTGVRR